MSTGPGRVKATTPLDLIAAPVQHFVIRRFTVRLRDRCECPHIGRRVDHGRTGSRPSWPRESYRTRRYCSDRPRCPRCRLAGCGTGSGSRTKTTRIRGARRLWPNMVTEACLFPVI